MLRHAIDLIVCFIIAVILLRGFVLEGYLISTGSMAPGLLGFHKRVVCPTCEFPFAFGVSFDESVMQDGTQELTEIDVDRHATCPNCGQTDIVVKDIPISHGDQLLVQKHLFDFRQPRRWESAVFRNPASPGEAYVKRVVGLPHEQIQVIDGDIYINGELARKDYASQKETRIPVCDLAFLADSADWEMPWLLDDNWRLNDGRLRTETENSAKNSSATAKFRYWRKSGGLHVSETPLKREHAEPDWSGFLKRHEGIPVLLGSQVEYDTANELLRYKGVMTLPMQNELIAQATDEEFRRAVYRLAALSHLGPVTDRYGYNALVQSPEYPVSDLMLRVRFSWTDGPESIRVAVPLDSDLYEVIVDPRNGRVVLANQETSEIIRETTLQSAAESPGTAASKTEPVAAAVGDQQPQSSESAGAAATRTQGLLLEVSNIDHQIIVAVNGEPCFETFAASVSAADRAEWPSVSSRIATPDIVTDAERRRKAARAAVLKARQDRWEFVVTGSGVQVEELQMFRDVYYTPGRKKNAVERPYDIPSESYFVLGDNSPVSSDSRNWMNPVVPHRMLIGKPFLVHLPSRPAVLEFGRYRWPIRIPDWHRIRYIH